MIWKGFLANVFLCIGIYGKNGTVSCTVDDSLEYYYAVNGIDFVGIGYNGRKWMEPRNAELYGLNSLSKLRIKGINKIGNSMLLCGIFYDNMSHYSNDYDGRWKVVDRTNGSYITVKQTRLHGNWSKPNGLEQADYIWNDLFRVKSNSYDYIQYIYKILKNILNFG